MGGGGGIIGTAISVVGVVTGNPVLVQIGSGINVAQGIANGNPLQVAAGAMGFSGAGNLASVGAEAGAEAAAWGSPEWMAAEDAAWFGDAGTSALENSLSYSAGADWVSPTADMVAADPTGMADSVSDTAWQDMFTKGANPQDTINQFYDPSKYDTSALMDRFSGVNPEGLNQFYTNTQDFMSGLPSNTGMLDSAGITNVQGVSPGGFGQGTNLNLSDVSADAFDFGNLDSYGLDMGPPASAAPSFDASGADFSGTGLTAEASTGFQKPNYTWQNKDFFGKPTGEGFTGDPATSPVYNTDLGNAGTAGFTQPPATGDKMFNLAKLFANKDNPYTLAAKGFGAVDSYMQNKKAMGMMEGMYNKAMSTSDPFASDRALASNTWQNLVQDPNAAWDRYIGGSGGDFIRNAAATYAKAGRRNMLPTLMSQAKQQYMSQFLPNYMKSVNPSQFPGGSGASVSAAFAPQLANMARNSNAPLFDFATTVANNDGAMNSLKDIFS